MCQEPTFEPLHIGAFPKTIYYILCLQKKLKNLYIFIDLLFISGYNITIPNGERNELNGTHLENWIYRVVSKALVKVFEYKLK